MARQNALMRLQKSLRARRAELCNTLADQLANLRYLKTGDTTGDSADAAFDANSGDVSSQLAELRSLELSQIEQALGRLKQGEYGICKNCEKIIPLTRLNALPYATLCIDCERQREQYPDWSAYGGSAEGNWDQVVDSDVQTGDQRITVSTLERRFASDR